MKKALALILALVMVFALCACCTAAETPAAPETPAETETPTDGELPWAGHTLYVANWPAPRSLHWQALLTARAIENQAYVAGCNRVGTDGNGHHYRGDSRIITPQGEILATAEPHLATRIDGELSLSQLQEYRENFPAWQDADPFALG